MKSVAKLKKSLVLGNIKFAWVNDPRRAGELADFFVRHVHRKYISHGEIQIGRALDERTWHPKLRQIIEHEIRSKTHTPFKHGRVAVALDGTTVIGLAIMDILKRPDGRQYAVFEDHLIARGYRGHGIGTRFVAWQERHLRREGVREIYLESGFHNIRAHRFFHRQRFQTISVVMRKKLAAKSVGKSH